MSDTPETDRLVCIPCELGVDWDSTDLVVLCRRLERERNLALAIARKHPPDIPAILAEVDRILSGIDKTEDESSNGYWETSKGAEFGAGRLSEFKEMIANSLTKSETQTIKITLRGHCELTASEAKVALDEAMTIIECVGTTGIHHKHVEADKWMRRYYPSYVDE